MIDVTRLLWFAILLQAAFFAVDLARYGFEGYLTGAPLAANITTYSAGGLDGAQILQTIGSTLTAGCVAAYVVLNEPKRQYNWRLLITLLLAVPLIRLDRGSFVINVLVLLLLQARSNDQENSHRIRGVATILVSLILAFGVALGFGSLRSSAISGQVVTASSSTGVLAGEFSPAVVVDYALAPGAPRFDGKGLYAPLLLRYVPRRIYADKPANTTMLYMQATDPHSYAAGFSLASTAVGAVVLNYGTMVTALLVSFVGFALGGVSSRRDTAQEMPSKIGYITIGFFSLYSFMRNDPVNSLSSFFAGVIMFRIILALSTSRGSRRL